ncbi:Tellurite methyltransferase [Lentibacillus sp. JNUCC-1]|uniref:helix-turn-helix domain-containing protein n=1 Tax=Lentibacillus sp. JNUCC-1 TaxID=2654513 RepID=UPI001326323E|nr:helix-turn-helix transcriptional regulator [Lentibacillus sp. JNUCC-1]MUV38703.1 Tellurite methyltransferase [Lentibacillus sp. JNUCC-1]
MDIERLAYNIKYYREQNGWTQLQLADLMLVSRSVIAKWENGAVKPDIDALTRMSQLFHISLDRLVSNHRLRDDLMKDAEREYQAGLKPLDAETVALADYLMMHPDVKEQIYHVKDMPFKKQQSLFRLMNAMMQEFDLYHS